MANQLYLVLLFALYCASSCLACKTKTGTRSRSRINRDGWETDSETETETDSGATRKRRSVGGGMTHCLTSEIMAGLQRSEILDYMSMVACRTHSKGDHLDVVYADWASSSSNNDQWSQCPKGYFLQGFHHAGDHYVLSDIKRGRCVRPVSQPQEYGQCYEMTANFTDVTSALCDEGHYITALYRGSCEELSCLRKLRCCKMA